MQPHDFSPRHGRRWHTLQRLMRCEDGGAGVELVLTVPLLMLLVLGVIQFALIAHAQHVASLAAAQGLAAARAQGDSAATGQARAEQVLAQLGRGVITGTSISASRTTRQARVEVAAEAESIIPGVHLQVRAVDAGNCEYWTLPNGSTP